MNRRRQNILEGTAATDLVDEATQLLRLAPLSVLTAYAVGTLPFLLVLLYFAGDMTHSAFAYDRCGSGAMGVAAAYVWMKAWHVVFAAGLKAHIRGRAAEPLTLRRWLGILVTQAGIQSWGLLAVPLAAVIMVPFGWVFAFFQNATVLGAADDAKTMRREAARLAMVWPRQNHVLLLILGGFGFFVFLNVTVIGVQLPGLLKTLLGVESAATLSPWAMLNTTFFAACFALTYLFLDPLVKAVYVLRCHYGAALHDGEDLLTDLRAVTNLSARAAVLVLLLLTLGTSLGAEPTAKAAGSGRAGAGESVSTSDLNRAIDATLSQREYAWRTPRQEAPVKPPGMLDSIARAVDRWVQGIKEFALKMAERIAEWFSRWNQDKTPKPASGGDNSTLVFGLQILAYVLIVALAVVVAVLGWRYFRNRRRREAVASQPVVPVPDLADDNVVASQLPEDGWLTLAREMMEKGELRLALRAFYLASLAHLAARELITVARFKTNLDYERELRRRARSKTELQSAFADNVGQFDRAWYGLHEVSHELLQQFQANFERIRTC